MNDLAVPSIALSPLVAEVAEWVSDEALKGIDFISFFDEFCVRASAIGLPLHRGHFAFRTLHPLFEAKSCTWEQGKGCTTEDLTHQDPQAQRQRWLDSPLRYMVEHRVPMLRRRLTGDDAIVDFPVLEEFRDDGFTDWLGYVVAFDAEGYSGMTGSWATRRPDGFSDTNLAALRFLQRPLAVAIKVAAQKQIAENVVHTYLGPVAGQRVLDGQIRRGDGESLPAVIWYSDLRGSTQMAEELGRDAYTAILNSYFEAMGSAVLGARGEILDFIGDAVLAIFPVDGGDAADACKRALRAAEAANTSLRLENEARAARGQSALAFGLALHVGEVMFGNIGTSDRLVFSVIGSSVNEVARLQDQTKELHRNILFSGSFAAALPRDWEDLGEHRLPGVGRPMQIMALPEDS